MTSTGLGAPLDGAHLCKNYDAAETTAERTRLLALGWDAVVVEPAPRGGARGDVADRFRFVVDATD